MENRKMNNMNLVTGFLQQRVIQLSLLVLALLMSTNISAKDLPGATQTSYGVSSGGAFQFSMPIIIPQGTNGVQPNLSLSFSSAGGNGSAGVGLGVGGLSAITRCGKTFATNGKRIGVQHNAEDRFCLGGQQLILVSGSYGVAGSEYRTEIDQFSKILAFGSSTNVNGGPAPARWQVWTKGGTIQEYGTDEYSSNTTGQFKLPNTNSIHSWKLSRVNDRHGNYYEVTYHTADGLVDKIDYTINVLGLVADKQVKFNYEVRPDTRSRYLLGSKIDIVDRLASITAKKGGVTIREYNLNYETAPVTNKSRVTSVTECGLNNACMPPITIDWQTDTEGYASTSASINKAPTPLIEHYSYQHNNADGTTQTTIKEINRGTWADVNGDGKVDLVTAYISPGGSNIRKTYIKTDTGWDSTQGNWTLPLPLRSYDNAVTNMSTGRFKSTVINQGQMIDVNGDGLVDVVYAYRLDRDVHQYKDASQGTVDIEDVKITYLNTGSGWVESSAYKAKDYLFDYIVSWSVFGYVGREVSRGRFVDINGDGLVDWITAVHFRQETWNSRQQTYINNGNGWTLNSAYAPPTYFMEYYGVHNWGRSDLVDVNGDGLLDWVEAYKNIWDNNQNLVSNVWLNTGTSFTQDNSYKLPEPIYENNGNTYFAVKMGSFVDVNGDGLADFVRSFIAWNHANIQQATLINKGNGWAYDTNLKPPFVHLDYTYIGHTGNSHEENGPSWGMQTRGYYLDVNHDGFVDFTQSYKDVFGATQKATWLNDGSQWVLDNSFNSTKFFFDYYGRSLSKARNGSFVDINSDGSPDWVSAHVDDISTNLNQLGKADQVAKITTTMGVEVIPTFLPLTDNDTLYQKGTGAAEQDALHIESVIYVTSNLQTSRPDGTGYNQTNYTYGGAQVHRLGRGFLGFAERIITNVQTGMVQQHSSRQDYPFTGMPYHSSVTDNTGTVISESNSTAASTVINHGNGATSTFVYVSGSDSTNRELGDNGGVVYRNVDSSFIFDSYGNMDVSTATVSDNVGVVQSVSINDPEYKTPDTANWLIGLVENTTTTLSAPNKSDVVRYNEFFYNTDGTLDYSVREPNSTAAGIKLTTTYGYDSYGNIETETVSAAGENSRVNTIGYDAEHRLPISLSNSLGQGSSIVYHPQCDQPDAVTDINNLVSAFIYDDFCRQTEVTGPTGVFAKTIYQTSNLSCTDSAFELGCQATPKLKITTQSSGQADVVSYFNSFAQSMLSATTGMLGEEIRQRTEYDGLGRVYRSSQPYFSIDQAYYTEYSYDDLNRTTQTTLPFLNDGLTANASVTQSYYVSSLGNQKVTTTDTKGRITKSFANALGQIIEIKDADNNSLKYLFDAQGNLSQTIDADVVPNIITVGYDILGRRTSLDDPDMGYSTYMIDAFGQKTTQTDAMLQTISMEYDVLGRMVKRTVPNTQVVGTYDISEWFFDTATNGVGSIASITGPNGYAKSFTYDQYSRPDSDTTTIKGDNYTQSYAFDSNGMLASRTYPESGTGNVFAVHYNYQNGYLSSITNGDINSANCIEHWRANTYDALGRTKNETLGKIVTTNRTFNQAQGVLERIHSIMDVNNGDTVQDLNYTYDAGNNVKTRDDFVASVSENFTYDNLDRLRFHNIGSEQTEVRYDAIGNITFKSDVGDYSYAGSGGPHAVSRVDDTLLQFTNPIAKFNVKWEWNGVEQNKAQPAIQNQDFIYDANGNIKQSGDRWVWWTAFDKPTRMERYDATQGTNIGSDFEYDAAFNRIYKEKNTGINTPVIESTTYIGKEYERITDENGAITHRYTISTGGSVIQVDRDDGTSFDKPKYLLGDNLGSTNIILDASGEVVQTLKFDPWGMRLNTGDTSAVNSITNRGYTGHEMDDEVSLTNMNARIYDPYLGRFLSADPVLPDAYDMQAYNRYSYVSNNPLSFVDPSGNSRIKNEDGSCLYVSGCKGLFTPEDTQALDKDKTKVVTIIHTDENGLQTIEFIPSSTISGTLYFDADKNMYVDTVIGSRSQTNSNPAVAPTPNDSFPDNTGIGGVQPGGPDPNINVDESDKPISTTPPENNLSDDSGDENGGTEADDGEGGFSPADGGLYLTDEGSYVNLVINDFGDLQDADGAIYDFDSKTGNVRFLVGGEAGLQSVCISCYLIAPGVSLFKYLGYKFVFRLYPKAGGGGLSLLRNGKRIKGIDYHRFKYNGVEKMRLHYHRGKTNSQIKKHRPYQGGI